MSLFKSPFARLSVAIVGASLLSLAGACAAPDQAENTSASASDNVADVQASVVSSASVSSPAPVALTALPVAQPSAVSKAPVKAQDTVAGTSQTSGALQVAVDSSAEAPEAIVERVCQSCHGLGVIAESSHVAGDWPGVVLRMRANGADLTDAEAAQVQAYLIKKYSAKP